MNALASGSMTGAGTIGLIGGSLTGASRTAAMVTTRGRGLLAAELAFEWTVRAGKKAAVRPARIPAPKNRNANFDLVDTLHLSEHPNYNIQKTGQTALNFSL
jgi:hypothetical protein